jgi:hypothetical protein
MVVFRNFAKASKKNAKILIYACQLSLAFTAPILQNSSVLNGIAPRRSIKNSV